MSIIHKIYTLNKNNKNYNYTIKQINKNVYSIYSKKYFFDSWIIKLYSDEIHLYHKNRNSQKQQYHRQCVIKNTHWKRILKTIHEHNLTKTFNRINTVDYVFAKYNIK